MKSDAQNQTLDRIRRVLGEGRTVGAGSSFAREGWQTPHTRPPGLRGDDLRFAYRHSVERPSPRAGSELDGACALSRVGAGGFLRGIVAGGARGGMGGEGDSVGGVGRGWGGDKSPLWG